MKLSTRLLCPRLFPRNKSGKSIKDDDTQTSNDAPLVIRSTQCPFPFRGRISPTNQWHATPGHHPSQVSFDDHIIAPHYIHVPGIPYPVRQYAPTVYGDDVHGFAPGSDCDGCFMSNKFRLNNNCYNYACNVASNSYGQPGRRHGYQITGPFASLEDSGAEVVKAVGKDGLEFVGTTKEDIRNHNNRQDPTQKGHYVALVLRLENKELLWESAVPVMGKNGKWKKDWRGYYEVSTYTMHDTGDFHFVRCDDPVGFNKWSQKGGDDTVTDFDFAGQPIVDPAMANWAMTMTPTSILLDDREFEFEYKFYGYLFVPQGKVDIL